MEEHGQEEGMASSEVRLSQVLALMGIEMTRSWQIYTGEKRR